MPTPTGSRIPTRTRLSMATATGTPAPMGASTLMSRSISVRSARRTSVDGAAVEPCADLILAIGTVYTLSTQGSASFLSLTYLLNNLSRSLGQPDAYPFVLSAPAVEKLRFVHETIAAA